MVTKMVTKCQIEFRHSFTLHSWRHMRIDVHRDCDCRMAQSLLHYLGMDTAGEQLRCMGVAQIVEPYSWKPRYAPNQIW